MHLVRNIIASIRPKHVLKNLVLLVPLVDSKKLFDLSSTTLIVEGILLFYLGAASMYLMNDIADLPRDHIDPVKRNRPIASGQLSVATAVCWAAIFGIGALVGSFALNSNFGWSMIIYLILTLAYSFAIKHLAFVDMIVTSSTFVLRAIGGYVLLGQPLSFGLLIVIFLITLLLAINRRAYQVRLAGTFNVSSKSELSLYTRDRLESILRVTTIVYLVSYIYYSLDNPHTPLLGLTIPLMVYCIMRFLNFYQQQKSLKEDAQFLFLADKRLLSVVCIWVFFATVLIYVAR